MSMVEERLQQSQDAADQYREISWPAMACLAFGIGSVASFPFATMANPTLPGGILYGVIPTLGILLGLRAISSIRAFPDELTGGVFAKIGLALSLMWGLAGWAIMGYGYATEVPPDHQRISYQLLQPEEKAADLPKTALELDGKQVFIKGYMYPGAQTFGIQEFILCRDNGDCCFGGKPPLTDMIYVNLKMPEGTDFTKRLRSISGTFRVEVGTLHQGLDLPQDIAAVVYHLDNAECR